VGAFDRQPEREVLLSVPGGMAVGLPCAFCDWKQWSAYRLERYGKNADGGGTPVRVIALVLHCIG
jgi:hypothetical protein